MSNYTKREISGSLLQRCIITTDGHKRPFATIALRKDRLIFYDGLNHEVLNVPLIGAMIHKKSGKPDYKLLITPKGSFQSKVVFHFSGTRMSDQDVDEILAEAQRIIDGSATAPSKSRNFFGNITNEFNKTKSTVDELKSFQLRKQRKDVSSNTPKQRNPRRKPLTLKDAAREDRESSHRSSDRSSAHVPFDDVDLIQYQPAPKKRAIIPERGREKPSSFGVHSNKSIQQQLAPKMDQRSKAFSLYDFPRHTSERKPTVPLRKNTNPWSASRRPNAHLFRRSRQDGKYEGFKNLGNTCYMNAVLCSLLHLRGFVNDLLNNPSKDGSFGTTVSNDEFYRLSLYHNLVLVAKQMQRSNHGVIDLTNLRRSFAARNAEFKNPRQQDAHEFLSECLSSINADVLHFLTPKKKNSRFESLPLTDEEKETQQALLSRSMQLSPTHSNFYCEITYTMVCENEACRYERSKVESCYDISLDLPQQSRVHVEALSLKSLLRDFCAPRTLELKCERCGHTSVEASSALTKLPKVLNLHIKRFQPNFETKSFSKRNDRVHFAKDLSLAPFCQLDGDDYVAPSHVDIQRSLVRDFEDNQAENVEDDTVSPAAWVCGACTYENNGLLPTCEMCNGARAPTLSSLDRADDSQYSLSSSSSSNLKRPRPDVIDLSSSLQSLSPSLSIATQQQRFPVTSYKLHSVVLHRGKSAYAGHYVTVMQSEDGTWHEYNDSVVKKISSESVLSHRNGTESYIFMFTRK